MTQLNQSVKISFNEKVMVLLKFAASTMSPFSGFPRGIESIEKVLNFEISFQDFEKVLNLAKMYIKYENSKFSHLLFQILFVTAYDSSADVFCIVFHQ